MSRSRRKTPIVGITTSASEKQDKKIWHKRMRSCDRTSLAITLYFGNVDSYLPLVENDVSNVWDMSKDGKQYWSKNEQKMVAEIIAKNKGQNAQERKSIIARELHKAMAK